MNYYDAYTIRRLEYIKNTSLGEMQEVRKLTQLCQGDTSNIDLYIKIKKDNEKNNNE